MFQALRRWLGQRRRRIYRFHDGKQARTIDPLEVIVGIEEHPDFDMQRHPREITSGSVEAMRACCKAVQDVFHVEPLEKGGLTMEEQMDVLCDFWDWWEGLKKTPEPSQMQVWPTDSTPDESTEPTTGSSAPCTPTSTEPRPATATECDREQTPPSTPCSSRSSTPQHGTPPSSAIRTGQRPNGNGTGARSREPEKTA